MAATLSPVDAAPLRKLEDRRRTEPRITCDRAISLLRCAEPDAGSKISARLTDCSLHGLGLMLAEAVEPGQPVLVPVHSGGEEMLLMYTIRYCIPMQVNRFRAGARFSGLVARSFEGELSRVLTSLTGSA